MNVRWLGWFLTLALSTLAMGKEEAAPVPLENQKKGVMPDLASWEADLRALIPLIEKGDTTAANDYFFPRAAFLQLKAMKGADTYYDKELLRLYKRDIAEAQEQLQGLPGWELASFEKGRCVWKDKGSEYNAIPYWSCYRNKIHLKKGGHAVTIPLRALINWGPRWYVTHLK